MIISAKGAAAAVLCCAGLALSIEAEAAPVQLYNKTILVSFEIGGPMIGANGRPISGHRTSQRVIYISSQGRMFIRASRFNGRAATQHDVAPGQGRGGTLHFQGNTIVGVLRQPSGAVQLTIRFDPGYQTCRAEVVVGRSNGETMRIKGLDGGVYQTTGKMTASGERCSIQDGNAFSGG